MMKYTQVVVNTPLARRTHGDADHELAESSRELSFTYSIPERLANQLALGQLVWVPFGKRRLQGIIISFSDTSPVEQTKDIEAIADPRPFLTSDQIALAQWIARTYLCSFNNAIQLMLPPGVEQPTEVLLSLSTNVPREDLTPKQTALVDLLARMSVARLNQIPRNLRSAAQTLTKRGIVVKTTQIRPVLAKPKHVNTVRFVSESGLTALSIKSPHADVLEYLAFHPEKVTIDAMIKDTKRTKKALQILANEDLIKFSPPTDLLIPSATKRKLRLEYHSIAEQDSKIVFAYLVLQKHHGCLSHTALQQMGVSRNSIQSLIKKGYARVNKETKVKRLKLGKVTLIPGKHFETLLHRSTRLMLSAIDYFLQNLTPIPTADFRKVTNATPKVLKTLIERGYVRREKTKPQVSLLVSPLEAITRVAELRKPNRLVRITNFLKEEAKPIWISAVYAAVEQATAQDLRKLEEAGVVALEEEEVWRDSLADRVFDVVEPPKLTPEQENAWNEIVMSLRGALATKQSLTSTLEIASQRTLAMTFLLHGVTGSGKTEIYMRALAEIIAQGKQGIVLVPEISLTPQTIRRFGARFKRIAVVHSRLSLGERYDTWRRCRDGLVDVVIGARSALFVPLPRLGLLVLDEEHDPSYKQAEMPYYHAREVALELARRVGATVILGSATPDVETYHRAVRGEFKLLELPKRIMGHRQVIEHEVSQFAIGNSPLVTHELGAAFADARYIDLPPVGIVDLRAELKAGNRSMFSRALQREMARVLAAREQMILFLNRRGTATIILCRDCGNVFKCKRCNNPMTYHGTGDQLVCHHCNRRDRVPTQCPQCGSTRIRYFGVGTEKVETEIQALFPKARTLRWDWDVTRGKESHEAILERFIQHQADILIGTQMIANGLDLPLVTLVGVVSADTSLNLPDFRSGERTFQLLTQVAGRAGRSILGGKVILQTYNPDHYAIQAASTHDYHTFYDHEIAFRRDQNYPPFSHLIRLLYTHSSEQRAQEETARMHRALATRIAQRGLPAIDLIGPAPAFFPRVRGEYRYQIIVRGRDPHELIADLALPLGWRIDVDPVSVL